MGRNKNCAYPTCKSDSRHAYKPHMTGVNFVTFPKHKSNPLKCKKWLEWLQAVRKDFKLENITSSTYLCTKHFVGGTGPTNYYPDPIHDQSIIVKTAAQICDEFENERSKAKVCEAQNPSIKITVSDKAIQNAQKTQMSEDVSLETVSLDIASTSSSLSMSETDSQSFISLQKNILNANDSFSVKKSSELSLLSSTSTLETSTQLDTSKETSSAGIALEITHHKKSLLESFGQFLLSQEWLKLQADNWYSNINATRLQFVKSSDETNCPLVYLSLDSNFTLKAQALHQNLLTSHLINLPNQIFNSDILCGVLKDINSFEVCSGIKNEELVNFLKERNRGAFCSNSIAIRDNQCLGISKNKKCHFCSKLERNSRKCLTQSQLCKGKKYKSLTKEEIIRLLKIKNQEEKNSRRKVKRLFSKLKKQV